MTKENNLNNSHFFRDAIIGTEDGASVSFAFVAGMTVLMHDNSFILMGGMVVIVLLSVAMGISGWLCGISEQQYYFHEIGKIDSPEGYDAAERADRLKFYESMGFPEDMRHPAMLEIDSNNKQWIEFLRKFDLAPVKGGSGEHLKSGLVICFSYALGGLIPLSPYLFSIEPGKAIIYSVVATLAYLFVLGYYKSKITGNHPFAVAIRVMLTGGVAAIFSHIIALFFK